MIRTGRAIAFFTAVALVGPVVHGSVANAAGFHPDSRCSLSGPWNPTQADRSSPRWSIVAPEKILLRCWRRFLTSVGFRDESVDRKVRFT